ncbi:MAG TPA: HK97 gp10 family phage protein [Gammaproteobacteria bacterium]|nr:HK97 gp10 family phage protein [Gammaproteobacteria bacterium]
MSRFGKILRSAAGAQLERDIAQALSVAADRVKTESQISITTGAVSGAAHVPSAPGEPPNNDTGGLAASHEVEPVAWNHYRVVVGARYAVPLETGSSRMAARPFLGPAARKVRPAMNKLVARAVKQAVARAVRSNP